MSQLIDPEFAKGLIADCEKIIKTLRGEKEPEKPKTLTKALHEASKDFWQKRNRTDFIIAEEESKTLSDAAKAWFREQIEACTDSVNPADAVTP